MHRHYCVPITLHLSASARERCQGRWVGGLPSLPESPPRVGVNGRTIVTPLLLPVEEASHRDSNSSPSQPVAQKTEDFFYPRLG